MNLWNVSMIVAPNLFIYKGKRANQQEMQAATTTAHIVRLLIRYQDILWTVSNAGSHMEKYLARCSSSVEIRVN